VAFWVRHFTYFADYVGFCASKKALVYHGLASQSVEGLPDSFEMAPHLTAYQLSVTLLRRSSY